MSDFWILLQIFVLISNSSNLIGNFRTHFGFFEWFRRFKHVIIIGWSNLFRCWWIMTIHLFHICRYSRKIVSFVVRKCRIFVLTIFQYFQLAYLGFYLHLQLNVLSILCHQPFTFVQDLLRFDCNRFMLRLQSFLPNLQVIRPLSQTQFFVPNQMFVFFVWIRRCWHAR